MSMFSRNNANVSMNSVKSLEMADVCANPYESLLSMALRQKEATPCVFKFPFVYVSGSTRKNSTTFKKSLSTTPLFLTASTTHKKPPHIYIFHPTEHNRVLDA